MSSSSIMFRTCRHSTFANPSHKFLPSSLFSSSSSSAAIILPQARFNHCGPGFNLPPELETKIEEKTIASRQKISDLKSRYGNTLFDHVTVKAALGGMRNVKLLLCETSQVDPVEGISYRGIPIQQLLDILPKAQPNSPPTTEALFWFLLTGEIPSSAQIKMLQEELVRRSDIPKHVTATIDSLPIQTHPMTQFIIGIAACQTESQFSSHYKAGTLKREDYWRATLDDGLSLVAKLPQIASQIYRRSFKGPNDKLVPPVDKSLDWAANAAHLMGFDDAKMQDVFRLYVFIHADHEGGNVSAHTAHLVASALSDPFLSFAASMAGLAGPLHGLANQECLAFLRQMANHLRKANQSLNEANVQRYVETEILGKGRVVPGFGHAVLRATDPRFLLQRQFALQRIQNDELTDLLGVCINVIPKILMATGKVSNPWPNVDSHSGVILSHFGLKEEAFFTVLFGLSRSIGVASQLVWDRALHLPIERPKSVTIAHLQKLAAEHGQPETLNQHSSATTTDQLEQQKA